MCAECHSTNLKKGYDAETETFNTTWSEISVGCEACHGPGSRHVAWARVPPMARSSLEHQGLVVPTSGITSAQLVELCAPCHSRRAELGDYDHTGRLLLDHMLPSLLTEGLYEADGQQQDEVYTYASFLQSKMYARGVRCSDCHDSHSGKLLRQGNELCLQCHQREVYDTADHHFHKKEVDGKPSDGALLREVPHARAAVHGGGLARGSQLPPAAARPHRRDRHAERLQPVGLPRRQAAGVGARTRTATGTAARGCRTTAPTFAAARAGKPGHRRGAAAHRRQHAAAGHRARHGADLPAAVPGRDATRPRCARRSPPTSRCCATWPPRRRPTPDPARARRAARAAAVRPGEGRAARRRVGARRHPAPTC